MARGPFWAGPCQPRNDIKYQGLFDVGFTHLEAEFSFSFPPDLHTVLALGLPAALGFPDWLSLECLRAALWPHSWGPHPAEPDRTLRVTRAALRRVPLLLPLFDCCYIPYHPCLASNPIFFINETRILCCGFNLSDFFRCESTFGSPSASLHLHPSTSIRRLRLLRRRR